MRRRPIAYLAGCALALAVSTTGALPAVASTTSDPQTRQSFEQWYANYGVPASVADALADKFWVGKLLDSANPSARPTKQVVQMKGNYRHFISYFEDGSISDTAIEQPAVLTAGGGAKVLTVGRCASTNGDHYYTEYVNCDIYGTSPYLEMHFRATYVLQAGSANDYIEEVASPYAYATSGTADTPTAKISRKKEDSANLATAYAQTQYHSGNITTTSFTATLTLRVGNNTATSSKSSGW